MMPNLAAGFGIGTAIAWRYVSETGALPPPWHESPDHLPDGDTPNAVSARD
jgi:hypothetical protein